MTDEQFDYEDCPPRADALIHSLRAFGYDLAMAIADLIDNSIFAGASNIWIDYAWNDGDPWIQIIDDGTGMTEVQLVEAMRLGSLSPLDVRDPEDLGRFGLGLKTASFSQCKMVTVCTKKPDGKQATRFWNLDYVQQVQSWKIGKNPPTDTVALLEPLAELTSGTVVLWQNLDRCLDHNEVQIHDPEKMFLEQFLYVKQYLEMVFHKYLEKTRNKLIIHVGRALCEPWDPYLRSNDYHQKLVDIPEKHDEGRVSVIPYVLPHVSKRSEEESIRGGGLKGWNAQQGFYVYRNGRMIVPGGYLNFDLKADEHCKLARISVDITNDMDQDWSIDVRKAVASPPDRLKADLLRVARATRQRASEVYRTRTGISRNRNNRTSSKDVWIRKQIGEKIVYRLNTNNPILKRIIDEMNPKPKWVRRLFHVIENTVPHRLIIMDGSESEDCHVNIPEDLNTPPEELLEYCREMYHQQRNRGRSHEEAADIVCSIQPFDSHPVFRACLDSLIEDGE